MKYARILMAIVGLLMALPATGRTQARNTPTQPIEIIPNIAAGAQSVAIAPNLERIATGEFDGSIKLWDYATGRLVRTFGRHAKEVKELMFLAGGTQILSTSEDLTIKLWDTASGQLLRSVELNSPAEYFWAAKFSSDGRRALTGQSEKGSDSNGIMKLWDTETGKLIRTFRTVAHGIAFSPDGKKVVSQAPSPNYACTSHIAIIWDTETGRQLQRLRGHKECTTIDRVAFSADGTRLVTSASDSFVKVWNAASGQQIASLHHSEYLRQLAYSPDGSRILTSSDGNVIQVWDANTGRLAGTFKKEGFGITNVLSFLPDGNHALAGHTRGQFDVFNVETGQTVKSFGEKRNCCGGAAFLPDSSKVVFAGDKLRYWDHGSGQITESVEGYGGEAYAPALSRDTKRALYWLPDGTLRVKDTTTGRELGSLEGNQKRSHKFFSGLALSDDGTQVLSCGYEQPVTLWDASSGRAIRTFEAPNTYSVALSPDGKRGVIGNNSGMVRLLDLATGQQVWSQSIGTGVNIVWQLEFSADGKLVLATVGTSGSKLLDAATGKVLRSFEGHKRGYITSVGRFSPDAQRVITSSHDQTVKVWETATGRLIRTLDLPSVFAVAISPDNKRAMLNGELWDLETGEKLVTVIGSRGTEWLTITPEGYFAGSEKGAEILSAVRGLDVWSIGQFYQALYRPDLVREKLAGDRRGLVREAAAKLDLGKVLASGNAPLVTIASPFDGLQATEDRISVEAQIADRGGGVGRVEWRVNGVTLGLDERGFSPVGAGGGGPGTLKRTLFLEDDENIIEVVAYNAQNLIASVPARLRVVWDGAGAKVPPRLHILSVGINAYWDSRLRLQWAVSDAKQLVAALQTASAGLYENVNVVYLADEDVKTAKLAAAFDELGKVVRPRDVFVFFLSGHGKTVDGRYYFIPQDFRYRDEQSFAEQGIGQDLLQSWLAKITARKSILLFDSCESGTLTADRATTRGLEQATAVERLTRAMGRTVLSAATESTPAFEGYQGHGVFTYALLDSLGKADSNNDGFIDITELAGHVDLLVPQVSHKAFGLRQVPQMKLVGSNFPFARRVALQEAQPEAPSKPAIPSKPTHVVLKSVQTAQRPNGDPTDVTLAPGTMVAVVTVESEWSLIAREGKPVGYVAGDVLAPIQ